ncbi:glycine cleavage H-protein-domain-containing protein [Suillus placidus]|uniref:Glycine cleavage system H protein n=1 Tax=Suillus placidus TaxID=48579 RepID=A0A9P7A964_9AGAM|nr:glycine cleavage H-protein-domain-containing protein [Suillus placidus]
MFSAIGQAARARTMPLMAARTSPSIIMRVPGCRTIVTKKYTEEHEVVAFDDETGLGAVSITDHAQESLGDVVFVELPAVGSKVVKGDQIGAVESVKAASDIYAPISGIVTEVNEVLNSEPGLLNRSPEDKGWLCKIKLSAPEEMNELLTLESYKATWEA